VLNDERSEPLSRFSRFDYERQPAWTNGSVAKADALAIHEDAPR
jgi:hypothetical protein